MPGDESVNDLFGLVGHELDGKYDVASVVAEGGFGVVYRATHRTLQKPVAIKVLKSPPDMNERARAAFLEGFAREAQTIARLDHPAIVRALDFGTSPMPSGDTAAWMVLEWVDGQTLASVEGARRGVGGRSPAEALALLRPVFEALAYAHEQGVAHRDIKPANIMLLAGATIEPTRHGKPTTRLLDFGIAKMMHPGEHGGSGHTRTRSTLLTFSLPYAAPEQVSGSRTGPWTDVHALALVLTELLTDRAPYVGTDPTEVCTQVLSPRRPTPGHFGVDAGCWEPVLARALALMPAERFQNADELFNALNADVPTVARHAAPVTLAGFAPTQMAPGAGHSTLRPREMDSTPPTPPRPPLSPRVLALTLGLAIALPLGLAMWRFRPRSEHTATAPASAPVRASAPSAVPAPPSPPAAPAPSQAVATPAPSAPVAPLAVSVRDADAGVNARPSASSGGRPPTRTRPRTDRSSGPPTAPVAPPAVVFVPVAPTPAPSAPTPHLATDRY